LKVLPTDLARDPSSRQRFEQEARSVAALNHPNIVAVYDVGENYFVSELVEGESLRAMGALPARRVIDLAVQIADGLAAAHAHGVTHRDLKPGKRCYSPAAFAPRPTTFACAERTLSAGSLG
jgi:serine/threonine protein kinase